MFVKLAVQKCRLVAVSHFSQKSYNLFFFFFFFLHIATHLLFIFSISALQWLCNADKKYHHPPKRLLKFFSTLYSCMVRIIPKITQDGLFVFSTVCSNVVRNLLENIKDYSATTLHQPPMG